MDWIGKGWEYVYDGREHDGYDGDWIPNNHVLQNLPRGEEI